MQQIQFFAERFGLQSGIVVRFGADGHLLRGLIRVIACASRVERIARSPGQRYCCRHRRYTSKKQPHDSTFEDHPYTPPLSPFTVLKFPIYFPVPGNSICEKPRLSRFVWRASRIPPPIASTDGNGGNL